MDAVVAKAVPWPACAVRKEPINTHIERNHPLRNVVKGQPARAGDRKDGADRRGFARRPVKGRQPHAVREAVDRVGGRIVGEAPGHAETVEPMSVAAPVVGFTE